MTRFFSGDNANAVLGSVGDVLLQAKAGSDAIAKQDLVVLGGSPPRLYPVKASDYATAATAGSPVVATTTVSTIGSAFETRQRAIVDAATGDIFFVDTYILGPVGCKIWKYSLTGGLKRSLALDSSTTGTNNYVQTLFLSNGTILVFWYNVGSPYTLFFAIVDKSLNVIVPKTAIASVSANPQSAAHCIALSGGGFALAYAHGAVGSYFTIRDNAGAVIYGPTLIAGAPTNTSGNANGPRFKLAQLSSGNIFVGIHDTSQSDAVRYCIFSTTGGVVKAYTVMTGHGKGSNYPEISVLPGFVCMAIPDNKAYVFNNAGALQGAPIAITNTARISTDGAYFYVFHDRMVVVRIQTTGAAASYILPGVSSSIVGDVIYERGKFIVSDGATYLVGIDADGTPDVLASVAIDGAGQMIGGLGDFCLLVVQVGKFQITKYINASIFGIAQTDVAAGSDGTLVTVAAGVGGHISNEIKGSAGKTFDHSAAPIVGQKGAMFLNSVALKGI